MPTFRLTSLRGTGPTASEFNFSDFCRKLQAGATDGQHYAPAWAALAAMFGASSVHLLRDCAEPPAGRNNTSLVHVLDPRAGRMALPPSVGMSECDHGLFGIARFVPRGVDAIVVLRQSDPFTEGERAWLELMLVHIGAAFELGEQLACQSPTVASVVQLTKLMPTPCVLTDEEGRCIARNHVFSRVLDATSDVASGGPVVFDDPFLQDSWLQALQEGRFTAATQYLLATSSSGEEWKGHVVPISCISSPVHGVPRHLMFAMFERSIGAGTRTRSMSAFGPLTKAELEVLASLLLGQTAKVIASTRGASVNTVRSQIATILEKTGHHSQKKLIASFGPNTFDNVMPPDTASRRVLRHHFR
nr:helix-turn-helix transcriptional regulator [Ramlibacter monticola]